MDVKRAEEILHSPDNITVTFQGNPVWIQSVNDVTQIANVYTVGNKEDEKMVPVSELQEK
ncbi:H-type small acid-soluble spore protein [Shimazuella sp. AN120528]|uniref:H-type small acid-soluble spore protein n=1 Tax=Shimazuella soli TaxID=1892854 RepID=UPI001F0DCC37|nr:H-type small acid-soluble spore protein [Shimazuella soli]MCH5584975.1 H-type small acid-soluble spore protein [Shimazuella soli]